MPVLTIDTNVTIPTDIGDYLHDLSSFCAQLLNKPESYVMVKVCQQQNLLFGGTDEPAAYCTLTSLGLTDEFTQSHSASLCQQIEDTLKIPSDRIYIEFKAPERSFFGWNKRTF